MAATDRKLLLEFFSRSLASFQSSALPFCVICTLPHQRPSARPGPRRRKRAASRLIVLDSSFNPPTVAHAAMAREAMNSLGARARGAILVLLLAVNNADKAPRPASLAVRLGMMEAFGRDLVEQSARRREEGKEEEEGESEGESGLEVDLAVTTMPYFHDKARAIGDSGFYDGSGVMPEQVFLAGFDTATRIFEPKYYGGRQRMEAALRSFFDRARLRVMVRRGDGWGPDEEQRRRLEEEETAGGPWRERMDFVEGLGRAVSSSAVRAMVMAGERVDDRLVGHGVLEWIGEEGLYREE